MDRTCGMIREKLQQKRIDRTEHLFYSIERTDVLTEGEQGHGKRRKAESIGRCTGTD